MSATDRSGSFEGLAEIVRNTRERYTARVSGMLSETPWWTAVIITASSQRQAERYEAELRRRTNAGRIPAGVRYLVVADPADQRIGSGGATLNALRELAKEEFFKNGNALAMNLTEWWTRQRVLLIHCGGDSRRLPQYSLSGKLFSAVPVPTPWGDVSTVFDETLALSTAWVERLPSGLVVGSGDVILAFDAETLDWDHPGVCGVAMIQPAETGTRHGVYVTDRKGLIYAFLQKPSIAELRAAGGLLDGDQVALDTGLMRFAPEAAARLTQMAGVRETDGTISLAASILSDFAAPGKPAVIDLYAHVAMALTGQWKPVPEDGAELNALASGLEGLAFRCSVVCGHFTHIGTTSLFRKLMTGGTEFSRLHSAQQQLGLTTPAGLQSAGHVIDSVLSGGADLGADTLVIECNLGRPVRAAARSILHGLDGIREAVDVAEDTVVHQVPVKNADGQCGVVIRVYGVEDDPKGSVAAHRATWFGRPMLESIRALGMDPEMVWPGEPESEWTLWNARLFPVAPVDEAWACARWLQSLSTEYSVQRWSARKRLSLATSTQLADGLALEAARSRRLSAQWGRVAVSLVESGADIRPLLVNSPGTGPLAETGEILCRQAVELAESVPTEAASRRYVAGLFFGQAGLAHKAGQCYAEAFRQVERAVERGSGGQAPHPEHPWQHEAVTVEGPARIDLGGGWSDTPPFCLDWGGTVLNLAVLLNGGYPIRTTIRTLREPLVRCVAVEDGAVAEYRTCEELLRPSSPGDPLSIPRTALRMTGLFTGEHTLREVLQRMGGGIEIETAVSLPMGSGLGTSSILAATTLQAISQMGGAAADEQVLCERAMHLEQLLTTGGGWQDQAGGIFRGAKLLTTGPGLQQRVRVQPLPWSAARQAEFESLMVLYYTGIRRVARELVRQVVARYLARETACVQVLHSIKTLAVEMAYAIQEGEWDHLGSLLDRHWQLNQILDPNTTNAPINALLHSVRPYIRGAKLAGAGGGGFLIMIARSPEAAEDLRKFLYDSGAGGAVYASSVSTQGLRIEKR